MAPAPPFPPRPAPFFQMPVITGPADAGQMTHPLHAQLALLLRPRPDRFVDAEAPGAVLGWRPSLILSKALRKKSFSRVFSASANFSLTISSCKLFLFAFFRGNPQICVPRFGTPFKLVFPGVEQFSLQSSVLVPILNVLAGFHPLDHLPFEFHGVSTPLCHLGHFVSIRCKVRLFACLTFRVQSIRCVIGAALVRRFRTR